MFIRNPSKLGCRLGWMGWCHRTWKPEWWVRCVKRTEEGALLEHSVWGIRESEAGRLGLVRVCVCSCVWEAGLAETSPNRRALVLEIKG